MTQKEFSDAFGIPLANVQNWEQDGRKTKPDTAARLLIGMIETDPALMQALVQKTRAFSETEAV